MQVKKWLLVFVLSLLGGVALLAAWNVVIDPFGVFGDRFFQWYAYDMTQNPRVAKIAWLDENYENYNSYVIGSSKASSLSVETLNAYTGDSYYNMTWYGGDLLDEMQLAAYIIENYEVENIILTIDPESANYYDNGSQSDLKTCLHSKVKGDSTLLFYARYIFANLSYSWDKLVSYARAGVLPDASSVYVPETGCYDKTVRDASPINDMASYLAYEGMSTYVAPCEMNYIDEAIACIQQIQDMCQENGISFTMVGVPISQAELTAYSQEDVTELWTRAAQITDFYTFWGSDSISGDLRYFYDTVHFRNCVGEMVLATLFDDDSVYVPEGFGVLTTADNARDVVAAAYAAADSGEQVTADVPILMYHSFTENPEEVTATNSLISDFEAQLKALRDAGYTSVTYQQLIDFVTLGVDLPEKPVVITMDDGYRDNLTLAAPLLEEYGFTANVAVIGTSVGHSTYKDSDTPITPHFTLEEALPWVEKGVLSVTTHSYDMHQVASLDGEDCRQGVLQMEGEREEAYIAALTEDYTKAQQQLTDVLGEVCPVYTYPYGFSSILSVVVLHDLGVQVTVTTEYGANQLLKGVPQSLYQLRRINVEGSLAADTLLDRIETSLDNLQYQTPTGG